MPAHGHGASAHRKLAVRSPTDGKTGWIPLSLACRIVVSARVRNFRPVVAVLVGMRFLVPCILALAVATVGCGGVGAQDRSECRAPVSGGTAAQRNVINDAICASVKTPLKVRIAPAPAGLPKGTVELVIDTRVPPEPANPTGRKAAIAGAARESASWAAAVLAGAVRDRSERDHLPRVMFYELRYVAPGQPPQLQTQGRIALPGWGDPEGQGSTPPATLGHGAPSFDRIERATYRLGQETHSSVRIGWGTPMGATPAIFIRAQHPNQLLAGPISRFLAAVRFGNARYDGVLIEVDDHAHTPLWMATTAERVGQKGCTIFPAVDTGGATAADSKAASHACAAAGLGFG
jgi:hypothetical protein